MLVLVVFAVLALGDCRFPIPGPIPRPPDIGAPPPRQPPRGVRPPVFRPFPGPKIGFPKPVPPIKFDCTKLDDGDYANPGQKCSREYFTCSNGWGALRKCAEQMYFNSEIGACDLYAYVPACSGKSRPLTTRPPFIPPQPRTPDPDFDCTRLPDGNYEDKRSKCSRRWFSCLKGFTTRRQCPNDLYYDIQTKSCQPWLFVYKCSGKEIIRTTPFPEDFPTLPPVPVNCKTLPDGPHPDPKKKCSQIFYVCDNGDGRVMRCPGGLYYNAEKRTCDDFSEVFPCSGRRPQPKPVTRRPYFQPPKVFPFSCKGKRDGNFPAGKCEKFYWACHGGTTEKLECPRNLHYDSDEDECAQGKHIPNCGGNRPTPPIFVPTKVPPVNFDCSRREDGNYPAGKCKTFYIACSGTVARRMSCGEETAYDSELDECNKREFIPECGGRRPPKPVPTQFIPRPNPYAKPRPVLPPRPVRPVQRRPSQTRPPVQPPVFPRPPVQPVFPSKPKPFQPRPEPRPVFQPRGPFGGPFGPFGPGPFPQPSGPIPRPSGPFPNNKGKAQLVIG